jgi:hypothetical protein
MKFWKQKTRMWCMVLLMAIVTLGFVTLSQVGCKKSSQGDIQPALPTTLAELVDYVSSAQDLLDWMRSNITYGWPGQPDMLAWRYLSPQDVFSSKQGDCTGQSAFEKYVLERNGYNCRLLWLERANYSDHAVCYWQTSGTLYYMEHGFGGFEGIYGPFNTVQEIGADMYANLITNDGLNDSYTLYHYDDIPYGVDWFEFHQLLTPIN